MPSYALEYYYRTETKLRRKTRTHRSLHTFYFFLRHILNELQGYSPATRSENMFLSHFLSIYPYNTKHSSMLMPHFFSFKHKSVLILMPHSSSLTIKEDLVAYNNYQGSQRAHHITLDKRPGQDLHGHDFHDYPIGA